jgi:hypothetical protein
MLFIADFNFILVMRPPNTASSTEYNRFSKKKVDCNCLKKIQENSLLFQQASFNTVRTVDKCSITTTIRKTISIELYTWYRFNRFVLVDC